MLYVNLHPVEFTHPNLAAVVDAAVRDTGVPPSCLRLELTEHLIMADPDRAVLLERLRRLGVSLCLDDCGTGHSSLSALHRFPISSLEVDRSFVARLGDEADGTEIVAPSPHWGGRCRSRPSPRASNGRASSSCCWSSATASGRASTSRRR
jgi:EAL domain-containing protein (putative c-di-GMP-specific phosphodiesterase class I)